MDKSQPDPVPAQKNVIIYGFGIDTVAAAIKPPDDYVENAMAYRNGWNKTSNDVHYDRMRRQNQFRCNISNPNPWGRQLYMTAEIARHNNTADIGSNTGFINMDAIASYFKHFNNTCHEIGLPEFFDASKAKITRLDVYFDLNVIPKVDSLLRYTEKGRNLTLRLYRASDNRIFLYDPLQIYPWVSWVKGCYQATYTRTAERPPVCADQKTFEKLLLKNEISVYIQNKSRKIRIYRKCVYNNADAIRCEASYHKAEACRALTGIKRRDYGIHEVRNLCRINKISTVQSLLKHVWSNISVIFESDILNRHVRHGINNIPLRTYKKNIKYLRLQDYKALLYLKCLIRINDISLPNNNHIVLSLNIKNTFRPRSPPI